jgi:hypothetical protein
MSRQIADLRISNSAALIAPLSRSARSLANSRSGPRSGRASPRITAWASLASIIDVGTELLDTKWAGVIQPDPDSAHAGEVEPEHILAPADGPRRTVVPAPCLYRDRARSPARGCRLLPRSNALAISRGQLSRESRLVVRVRKPIT